MSLRVFLKMTVPAIFIFQLVGCVPPAKVPMRTVYFTASEPAADHVLFVFLPGKGDDPESFETEGFVGAVQKLGLPVDMMGADAHMGYYMRENFLDRLKEDVIMPAKARGYKRIWLIGISLGGLGVLWYDGTNPADLEGLVSLAPYLGGAEMGREVALAGGLAAWNPSHVARDDPQRRIWQGLKVYLSPEKTVSRVYLGYGLQDGFASTDGAFAKVLPGKQVFTCDGGHDWVAWRRLWRNILFELKGRLNNPRKGAKSEGGGTPASVDYQ